MSSWPCWLWGAVEWRLRRPAEATDVVGGRGGCARRQAQTRGVVTRTTSEQADQRYKEHGDGDEEAQFRLMGTESHLMQQNPSRC